MVKPVTPNPKRNISFTAGVIRGWPGTQGQLAHIPAAASPDARIGLATSAQYPHPVYAMAMATTQLITFAQMSISAMRRNSIALRMRA